MKTGVITTYKVGEVSYGAYILGSSMREIERKVRKRGLNEKIESSVQIVDVLPDYKQLTNEEFIKNLPEILHTTCFIGFLVLKAGAMTIEEVLGDEGVIHQLSHILSISIPVTDASINRIRKQLCELQRRAIGVYDPV